VKLSCSNCFVTHNLEKEKDDCKEDV